MSNYIKIERPNFFKQCRDCGPCSQRIDIETANVITADDTPQSVLVTAITISCDPVETNEKDSEQLVKMSGWLTGIVNGTEEGFGRTLFQERVVCSGLLAKQR